MPDKRAPAPHPDDPHGLAPRRAALELLRAVERDAAPLGEAPESLPPPVRARARRLAADVLRHRGRADTLLARSMAHPPPRAARDVLRLAVVELCAHGAAPHGAVDAAVRLMRADRRGARLAGLANAVLRRIATEGPDAWAALPPDPLPGWLRAPLLRAWGAAAVAGIEAAHAAGAPLDLTLREPAMAGDWAARLGAEVLPTGSLRLPSSTGQLSALPGHDEGAWWVQDAAAAVPVRTLGDVAGADVLDLCAAPGGKTLQLASAGASVTALDRSATRLGRLAENLARTGLSARIVAADALDWEPGQSFDAIVLDAPCSASGTIRRHPELPHIGAGRDIAALAELQARLFDRAAGWLRPGGWLVFCTCSLLPDEGEAQFAAALVRHASLEAQPLDPTDFGLPAEAEAGGGGLRLRPDLWPERGGMDGFFIAVFRRHGVA